MKLVIIIICLLLTGCKIDYSLKITNDNQFIENAELNKYFPNGSTSLDELGSYSYNFANELRSDAYSYLNKIGYSNYSITDISSNNYEGIRVKRTYKGPNSYNYNLLITNLYDDFSVNMEDDIVTINAKGFNREKVESKYEMLGMTIDNSSINVELPYKVIENNADSVDESNNVYTWYINDDTVNKDILLKYDLNNIYAINIKTLDNFIDMTVVFIILAFIIFVIVCYIIYIYVKKVYENKNKF